MYSLITVSFFLENVENTLKMWPLSIHPAMFVITVLPNTNGCHTNLSFIEENIGEKQEANEDSAKVLREILKKTLPDEQVTKDNDNNSVDSDDGYTSEGMSIADSDNFELFMPMTFVDMVPVPDVILSSRRNSKVSGIGQFISSSRGPSRTASRKFQRSASQKRRASTDIIDEYGNSRRGSRFDGSRRPSNMHPQWNADHDRVISRQNSRKKWESTNVSQFPSQVIPEESDVARQPAKVRLSLTPELITEQYVINHIEDPMEPTTGDYAEIKKESAWIKLLKNPDFYRVNRHHLIYSIQLWYNICDECNMRCAV